MLFLTGSTPPIAEASRREVAFSLRFKKRSLLGAFPFGSTPPITATSVNMFIATALSSLFGEKAAVFHTGTRVKKKTFATISGSTRYRVWTPCKLEVIVALQLKQVHSLNLKQSPIFPKLIKCFMLFLIKLIYQDRNLLSGDVFCINTLGSEHTWPLKACRAAPSLKARM